MSNKKESFTVANIVPMVARGERNRVDICLEPPEDHDWHSAEDSRDEDFRG